MRSVSVLVLLLVLAGCHSAAPLVEYRERVVPVQVACVDRDALPVEPVYATAAVGDQDTLAQAADAYLIERNQMRSYVSRLNAVIEGCLPGGR